MTHSCQLENFSGKILQNGGDIDGGLGTNTHLVLGILLQETLDTTARELSTLVRSDNPVQKCCNYGEIDRKMHSDRWTGGGGR